MDFEIKKSGQIPAFGNWDYSNNLPITQYFECARQAGLIRGHTSSFCECPPCSASRGGATTRDLYAGRLVAAVPARKATRSNNNGHGNKTRRNTSDIVTKQQQVKKKNIYDDVEEQPRNQVLTQKNNKQFPRDSDVVMTQRPNNNVNVVKPVDEDLYKIPPDLLHGSSKRKRKKMLGFFSRCLVPPCKA